jgi:YD repeat-containing protein
VNKSIERTIAGFIPLKLLNEGYPRLIHTMHDGTGKVLASPDDRKVFLKFSWDESDKPVEMTSIKALYNPNYGSDEIMFNPVTAPGVYGVGFCTVVNNMWLPVPAPQARQLWTYLIGTLGWFVLDTEFVTVGDNGEPELVSRASQG